MGRKKYSRCSVTRKANQVMIYPNILCLVIKRILYLWAYHQLHLIQPFKIINSKYIIFLSRANTLNKIQLLLIKNASISLWDVIFTAKIGYIVGLNRGRYFNNSSYLLFPFKIGSLERTVNLLANKEGILQVIFSSTF